MASFTVTQWAILALVFVAGWLLGLASHGGGRKWRDRYAAEREAHAQQRRDVDARVKAAEDRNVELERGVDARVKAAEDRNAELERENERLRSAAPVTSQTVAPRAVAARPAYPAGERPVYAAGERRGWFDWGPRRV